MSTAITSRIEAGEREGFVKATPGSGKTTFYCELAKLASGPVPILLPNTYVYDQIRDWIGLEKDVMVLNTVTPAKLDTFIESISEKSVILCNYQTWNLIHKDQPGYFAKIMKTLVENGCRYVFSDELHRGIGKQTVETLKEMVEYDDKKQEQVIKEQETDEILDEVLGTSSLVHI